MQTKKQIQRAKYQALLTSWKESGLSKQAFCSANSIPYHGFLYWDKKLNPARIKESFRRVKIIPGEASSACYFSVEYPSGCVLKIHRQAEASFLHQLVSSCN